MVEEAIQIASEGNLAVSIPYKSKDEIGRLNKLYRITG